MINFQPVTLNGTTQLPKLCMSMDEKTGNAHRGHDLMNCKRLCLTRDETTALSEIAY